MDRPDPLSVGSVSPEQLEAAIRTLEAVVDDRAVLLALDAEQQTRLLRAAGLVAHPGRAAKRRMVQAARDERRQAKRERLARDEQRAQRTGIRQLPAPAARALSAPPHPDQQEPSAPPNVQIDAGHFRGELEEARNCYICKQDFRRLHFFYDLLCPACAEFNWAKRHQSCDLSGRTALLTGGRVKIGFEAALKLLRAGASVVITTRFPIDAAQRFLAQQDSSQWKDRLRVYGLDMRHVPSVERLAEHLQATLPQLDFILNNACQTVRRPPGFYRHLMQAEQRPVDSLPESVRSIVRDYQQLVASHPLPPQDRGSAGLVGQAAELPANAGLQAAAQLSQLALLPEDVAAAEANHFPTGCYDGDRQQIDLREKNSWRLKLAEVATVELLEVQLVNAVAPYLLNARLKPLMLKTASRDKHIVNVSAMEGVFYRAFKRDTHPHTNMAKAALNMMTRTAAADYIQDGIHMNSVDTGWITDEDPVEITERKRQERGFRTPLDCIDAAARICDPIFDGVKRGEFVWGKFLKDYQVSNW